jgi:HEAT repeats
MARALQNRWHRRTCLWVKHATTPTLTNTMKNVLLLGALLASASLGMHELASSHGGTYRGPGDTVPPGGGGGGNGGPGSPSSPGSGGPTAPGPSGPITPPPVGPGAPGKGPSTLGLPSTPQAGATDLTLWQFWWGFNKDPYLNLKSHIHGGGTITGSDDFFIGHGQKGQAKDSMRPSEATIRGTIVPALLSALEHETNNDIVTGALVALAKIGDEPSESGESKFEKEIAKFLNDSNQEIAETAAVALGILGNPASIELLTSLAMDTKEGRRIVEDESGVNVRTRAFAVYGLGQIGHGCNDPRVRMDIVEKLWELSESPRMSTRDLKVAAIISMGIVPLEVESVDAVIASSALEEPGGSMAPRNRREQIEYLLAFLQSKDERLRPMRVKAHAPRALANLLVDAPEWKPLVVEALAPFTGKRSKGERELRMSAMLAFGQLGDLDDQPEDQLIRRSLRESAKDADQQVKSFSMIALGQVGGRVGNGDGQPVAMAELRKYLMKQLANGKTQQRPWVGLAMGIMERGLSDSGVAQSPEVLRALSLTLEGTKTKIEVGAYAVALGIARDRDSQGILQEKLDRLSDDDVRGQIALGLGLMNSADSKEQIQELVADAKYRGELLKQTAIALGLLGDKHVVTELVSQLKEAKTLSTQAAIASALGFIGDYRSVDPLVEMLEDDSLTGGARGFAAVALGIVADRETLPWNAKFSVNINYRANTSTLTGEGGTGLLDIL